MTINLVSDSEESDQALVQKGSAAAIDDDDTPASSLPLGTAATTNTTTTTSLFWRVAALAWVVLLLASVSARRARDVIGATSRGEGSLRGLAATSYTIDIAAPYLGPIVKITEPVQLQEEPTSRIINGQPATPKSFFTMLLIQNNGDWRWSGCGGTLISACHVLTAGHCLSNPTMTVEGVFVNAYSPFHGNNNGFPFHFSLIQAKDVHPQFVQQTNQADIGILTLKDCVDVNAFPPAMLTQDRADFALSPSKLSMQVMGFGSMSDTANVPADSLRSVVLPFIPRDQCRSYYPQGEVLDDMVCAGFADTGGPDACQGDSGGGMFLNGADTLVGVTSWGVGCGRKNYPGVYIYIPFYRGWITGKICSTNTGNQGGNCAQRAPSPQQIQQQQSGNSNNNNNNNSNNNSNNNNNNNNSANNNSGKAPQQQQQQQQSGNNNSNNNANANNGTCRKEGQSCDLGGSSVCCSNVCRAFPGMNYRVCTGALTFDLDKLGGAGGAKQTP